MNKSRKEALKMLLNDSFTAFHQIGLYLLRMMITLPLMVISFKTRIRSWFHPDKLLIEKPYQGGKIILIALFEKGILRNDIKHLLSLAKRMGCYIVAVNTATLQVAPNEYVDCYIERFNFGRDFGSYKTGFLYLLKKGILKQCPKLLMLNDSVFYESTRSENFISLMMNTDVEVLGATENIEQYHHMGSFCISFDHRILNHRDFSAFWHRYKNSEVRPRIISYGERNLSGCVRKIVSDDTQFRAAYNMHFISEALQSTHELSTLFRLKYQSNFQQFYNIDVWKYFIEKEYDVLSWPQQAATALPVYFPKHDLTAIKQVIASMLHCSHDDQYLNARIDQYIKSIILQTFQISSQIHCNCLLLFHLGLPLIKLDIFYRGSLTAEEVLGLSSQMHKEEAQELERLLFMRSHGLIANYGVKKVLFRLGFI